MKKIVFGCLAAALLLSARPVGAEATTWQQNPKMDSTTLWHFLVSAGGTVIGSQVYQYYGMDRTPANVISPIEMLGVGLVKGIFIDNQLKPYSFAADGLGLLVGTVINVTIHFDYAGRREKDRSKVSCSPAPGSPLAFSYRDEWPFKTREI